MGVVDDHYGGYENLWRHTNPHTGEVDFEAAYLDGYEDEYEDHAHGGDACGGSDDDDVSEDETSNDDDASEDDARAEGNGVNDKDMCAMVSHCQSCGTVRAMDERVFFAQDDPWAQLEVTSTTPRRLMKAGPKRTIAEGDLYLHAIIACSDLCLEAFKKKHADFTGLQKAADGFRDSQARVQRPAAPHSLLPCLAPYVLQMEPYITKREVDTFRQKRTRTEGRSISWEAVTVYAMMMLTEPVEPVTPHSEDNFGAVAIGYLERMVATKGDFVSRLGDWKQLTFTKERALGLEGWLCSPGARNHPFRPLGLLRQMNELVMFIHDQQYVHCSPLAYLTVYGPEAPSAAPSGSGGKQCAACGTRSDGMKDAPGASLRSIAASDANFFKYVRS
eukprot:CAMPEP_0198207176 /NCGR_PEP_ID=MMETSP1445-20131203/10660_1 /TAXON_ID=36898 /ORGANISM="Pyramimonas sp., Strain CCMP2087" /LENGTH=388 /DNA_ID=CAMNT_0043880123 /DNA_START=489 /DNA_END=1653 /DNA_ORIENTATION=-